MKSEFSSVEAGLMPAVKSHCRDLYSQSFGRFLRRPENRAARLACSQVVAALRTKRHSPARLSFLHGPPGSGKSHLAAVIADRITRYAARSAGIVAARDLGKRLAGQIAFEGSVRRQYRDSDLLVIEDMQQLPLSAAAAIVALLDLRQARRQVTLLTASAGPFLPDMPIRLTSRLASGLVFRIRAFGVPSLQKLARFWCEQRNLRLDDELIPWLVEHSRASIRTMLGNLARLQQMGRQSPRPLGMKDAECLLDGDSSPAISPLEAIGQRVANWFDVPPEQLRLRDRRPNLLWPRQVAMYLARRQTRLSLAAIGEYFGGCDHTTVMHALRKVEQRLTHDSSLAAEMDELMS